MPLAEAEWAPLAALRPVQLARHAHFVAARQRCPKLALALCGSLRRHYPRPDGEERTTYFFFENHSTWGAAAGSRRLAQWQRVAPGGLGPCAPLHSSRCCAGFW